MWQLLAKLEPLTAKATTAYDNAVRPAVTSAVDAIRSTLVRLAPLAEQARGNLLVRCRRPRPIGVSSALSACMS